MNTESEAARICSEMVQIRSENPPGSTEDVIHYIKGFLDSLGVRSTMDQNPDGHYNLVTEEAGKGLLLCGHVDVVPALAEGWTHEPFSGKIDDRYVWGRGATDMKGGCAALLSAYKSLVNEGMEPDACFAFVCDEETGGEYGIRSLLAKQLIKPCDCLIAEPTPALNPSIGQKGLCRINFHFRGSPGHGSLYPMKGTSAVMEAFDLLNYLYTLHRHDYAAEPGISNLIDASSRVLGELFDLPEARGVLQRIMFNPGKIEGGEKANIVAQQCTLELDIRIPWGCDPEELLRDLSAHAPRATTTISSLSRPSLTPPDSRLVAVTCREITRVHGQEAQPIVQWAATDARFLRKQGYSVLEYGPGELETLHAIDERVTIESLEKAVDVYQGIIRAYSQ